MSKKVTPRARQLIVDADIIHAASGSINDLSTRCREVLAIIQQAGHEVVRTPAIEAEWNDHASRHALRWMVEMESRRRLIDVEESDTGIAGAIARLPVLAPERKIMLKDCHLLEAALASEQRIVSNDEAAYFHFYNASGSISQLRVIMWVSPTRNADACAEWLVTGAKEETKRKIGRRPHRSHPEF